MDEKVIQIDIEETYERAQRYMDVMCGFNRDSSMAVKSKALAQKVREQNFKGMKMSFLVKGFGRQQINGEYFEFDNVKIKCTALNKFEKDNIYGGYVFIFRSPMPDIYSLPVSKMYLADSWETCFVDAGRDILREKLLKEVALHFGRTLYITDTLAPGMAGMSSLNPQCAYAQDVVSRIKYTSTAEDGLRVLYEAVRDEINNMIKELCEKNKVAAEYIYEAVYSGNTTMMHLATDTDPYSLGQYPYTPVISGGNDIDARKCGLIISEMGSVYLPPIISSYVGADITSGVLACKLADKAKNVLFIDIGTNGEMILEINGKLTACSTAAGPAFEGMNITFGMRAGNGAIEYFKITDDDIEIRTIGDKEAKGICGSGLFDVAGELVRVGIIEKNGKIIKKEKCTLSKNIVDRITKYDGKSAFLVADNVYLTLLDIRQIQLAKSAIRAGIEAMTGLNKVQMSDIDEVYIAGSFGYHLTPESLVNTGIIPKELQGKIKFVGNTSKTGGNAFLLNVNTRKYISEVVKKINTIELSDYPGFEDLFIKEMSF